MKSPISSLKLKTKIKTKNVKHFMIRSYWILFLILICELSFAYVQSTTGEIIFDTDSNGTSELKLNTRGLAVGQNLTPSTNLYVQGNTLISKGIAIGTTSVTSSLTIGGTLGFNTQLSSGNITLSDNSLVFVDTANGNTIITLPDASSMIGRIYHLKKTNSAYEIILQGGGNIDNFSDVKLDDSATDAISVISTGDEQWNILSITGNGNAISSDNLIGWWKLDETTGLTAHDSRLNNNGTLTGSVTFAGNSVSGKVGQGLFFDGSTDSVSIPHSSALVPTDQITVSAWVKKTGAGGAVQQRVVGKGADRYIIYFVNTNTPQAYIRHLSTPKLSFGHSVVDNEWTHLAFTYHNNGTANNYVTYLNGTFSSNSTVTGIITSDTLSFNIGSYHDSTLEFEGVIDDVRIFNKALTASEINAIYEFFK